MFEQIIFYSFSAVLVAAATMVITVRNPVHAALFLVLAFFSSAGLWLLLEAEFLAIALVLVYVGAVMVLFVCRYDAGHQYFAITRGFRTLFPGGSTGRDPHDGRYRHHCWARQLWL